MAVKGKPRTHDKKFAFIVEIEGFASAAFQKCSELSSEIAKIEYYEGGSLIPNKSPGRVTVTDVTLERGHALGDNDLYSWYLDVVKMSANTGLIDNEYKRSINLIQLDRDGSVRHRWICDGCFPIKFVAGDWDNEADENVIESITITMDTFDYISG
jgi:phage tail-like protein